MHLQLDLGVQNENQKRNVRQCEWTERMHHMGISSGQDLSNGLHLFINDPTVAILSNEFKSKRSIKSHE